MVDFSKKVDLEAQVLPNQTTKQKKWLGVIPPPLYLLENKKLAIR